MSKNQTNITEDSLQEDPKPRSYWQLFRRVILFFLFLYIVVCFGLFFVVKNERFQNYIIGEVTTELSNRLNTKVEIDHFKLSLFDQVAFNGFYVEDELTKDTLLFANTLTVNLNTSLQNILQQKVVINDISINDANIRIRRDAEEFKHNIELLLAKLANDSPQKKKKRNQRNAFELDLDMLYLDNVRFFKSDIMRGEDMDVYVDFMSVEVDELDFEHKYIAIESVEINSIQMDLVQYGRDETFFDYWYNFAPTTDSTTIISVDPTFDSDSTINKTFVYSIKTVNLCQGAFFFDNDRIEPIRNSPRNILDYEHLSVVNINGTATDFHFENREFSGQLANLSFKETSGFQLNQLAVDSVIVSPLRVELYNVNLDTPDSNIGDTLKFSYETYESFMTFKDDVRMDIRFNNSTVAVKDITTFIPKLKEITFFKENENELLELDGRFTGKINNLKGRNLDLNLGGNTYIKGDFRSRNLAVRNEEYINLNLEKLQTTIPSLKELIPNLNLPSNFDKLGNIDFSGKFNGFFIDFVAYGELNTDLGRSTLDMQMKFNDSRANASYNGDLELIDFDLATWANNPDFGIVTFKSQVKNGVGLTLETADAALFATIEKFPFKGYTYRNLTMEGSLRQNFFDGDFSIQDENIDLGFTGKINFESGTPIYDFDATIKKLDLQTLNLTPQNYAVSGNFDLNMQGNNLSDMQGQANIDSLSFVHNDTSFYKIDTIVISSTLDELENKHFEVNSEVVDITVNGSFDIQKVPNSLKDYLVEKYPNFAQKFNINPSNRGIVYKEFDFNVFIKNSKNLTQLIDPKLDTLKDIKLVGYLNNEIDSLVLDLEIPKLRYGQFLLKDIIFIGEVNSEFSEYNAGIYSTILNNKTQFKPVNLLALVEDETVSFSFNSVNFTEVLDNININGALSLTDDDLFQISFLPSNLVFLNEKWNINPANYVRFGNNSIYTRNFRLTNNEKEIRLETLGKRGLSLNVENYNLGFINDYWTYDKLIFDSDFTLKASTKDVFNLTDLEAEIVADTFKVNNDDFGVLQVKASTPSLKSKIDGYISLTDDHQQLLAEGYFIPKGASIYTKRKVVAPNYFSVDVGVNDYPIDILEYFIPNGISETVGTFNGDFSLFGQPNQPNIKGALTFYNGGINIDYLGTRYFFDNQTARLSNTMFDGTGAVLTDKYGNKGNIFGGIAHDNLKNLRLSARIETDRLLALDTKKEDNPIFYGTALGSGVIDFTGPFRAANIVANAVTGAGTKIIIPINYEKDGSEVDFIEFVDRSKVEVTDLSAFEIKGLNLELNLTMTEQAETQLVFDEQAGDIIKGFGDGNIRMVIARTGDFKMYGDYIVDHGDYLFTYKVPSIDVPLINKRFIVKEGGTINWNGDPLNAEINLEAEYKGVLASPYNLVSEFLDGTGDENLLSSARRNSRVDLKMLLTGQLEKPDIKFDLNFPDLIGRIKTLTDNKIRLLKQDPLELNRQVFGLIVIGGFLPSGQGFIADQTDVLINNTLSQVVSNQLSSYITEFIRESIDDDGPISGIDFDVNYSEYLLDNLEVGDLDDINRGKELSVRPRFYFLDDRLTLDIGVGIGLQNNEELAGATSRLNSQDVVFEFSITEDRRLKIRAYNRYEQTIAGLLNRTGLGLTYRREFDTFKELFKRNKSKKNEKKNKIKKK